jgi:hypothetical protein
MLDAECVPLDLVRRRHRIYLGYILDANSNRAILTGWHHELAAATISTTTTAARAALVKLARTGVVQRQVTCTTRIFPLMWLVPLACFSTFFINGRCFSNQRHSGPHC